MPPENMPHGKAILGTGPKQAPGSIVARLIRLLACPTRTMATKGLGLSYNSSVSFIIFCFAISALVITMAGCAGFSSNAGAPPLAITISALPSGTAQSAYSATLAAAAFLPALVRDPVDTVAHEAIIALCKIGRATDYTTIILERLHDTSPGETPEQVLEWLRTIQLALIHTKDRPDAVRGIAVRP